MKKILLLGLCFLISCENTEKKVENAADCDKDKAQKTIEEIKTNDFSLLNKKDAGCGAEATPALNLTPNP